MTYNVLSGMLSLYTTITTWQLATDDLLIAAFAIHQVCMITFPSPEHRRS